MTIYNSSGELISTHKIEDGNTHSFTLDGHHVQAPPFWFASQIPKIGDSIYLTFSDERYLTYRKEDDDPIFLSESYHQVEIEERNTAYYWEFTAEDYENATKIE
jgi:hypothetical protein